MILGGREFDFSRGCYVMGILNVTPDSFSDGGRFLDPEAALDRALRMEAEGADLIDVGAESTRPGSQPVSQEEELRRLLPVLKKLLPRLKTPVSVDTQKAAVAEAVLSAGAAMINDVSALQGQGMAEAVAKKRVPVILMHKKGEPATMQENPSYADVVSEVVAFLKERIESAVARGVDRDKILVDPGLGFGKRFEDNLELINRLSDFGVLRAPVVVGASRKSFIRKIFGEDERSLLAGSVAAATLASVRGAAVLRVHDVAATKAAIQLAAAGRFP